MNTSTQPTIHRHAIAKVADDIRHLSNTITILYNTNTRAVQKISSHFEYLKNWSCGLEVICQPVRGDCTVHP
jgi:hypothetical protein